jgi:hypothetical protein
MAMFLVWIGFSALAFVWNLDQRSLLTRAREHPFSVSIGEVRDAESRADFVNHTALALVVITAAFFITWLYLEYRMAQRTSTRARFEAGWAIGAWFVPIVNWFRPYQVMEDVWSATAGRERSRALVASWWGFSVGSVAVALAAGSGGDARTINEALTENGFYVARAVLTLLAAVFAMLMVRAVLHEERVQIESTRAEATA